MASLPKVKVSRHQLLTKNPAHKSGDAWVRVASSVQSHTLAQSFFNALPAVAARWKRCVPRFAPINVLIAMDFYLHSLQIVGGISHLAPYLIPYSSELPLQCPEHDVNHMAVEFDRVRKLRTFGQ